MAARPLSQAPATLLTSTSSYINSLASLTTATNSLGVITGQPGTAVTATPTTPPPAPPTTTSLSDPATSSDITILPTTAVSNPTSPSSSTTTSFTSTTPPSSSTPRTASTTTPSSTGTTTSINPPNSTSTPDPPPSSHLSSGAIAGIAIGSIVGAAIFAALLFYIFRMRRRVRDLNARLATGGEAVEKAELGGSEKRSSQRGMKAWELPARDETQVRAELEGSRAEIRELG